MGAPRVALVQIESQNTDNAVNMRRVLSSS